MADARSMGSGMQGHLNLRDAPPPLTNFDNSDAVPTANAQALMPIQRGALHRDGIFISLLKRWCEATGKSISQRQRLYKKMFQEYEDLPQAHIEALLKKLVSWSLSSSGDDSPDGSAVLPFIHNMPSPDNDQSSYYHERYKKEFIQKELIGKGSFGKVYKAQHKLDKKYYAVKKIKVTERESHSLQREIQTLACLDHPNVVRYHNSWLEEEFQVVSKQTEKQPLMLALRPFNDMEIGYKGEEKEERKEIENDGDDSCQENESIIKLGSTLSIITEFVETRSQRDSQQTSMTVSMNQAEKDPFDPNFTAPFEDKRFDSSELVNEFFSQTSENVENIRPLACNKSSGTSGSAVIFQNVESDGRDCDDFYLPSLKEQNSSEFVRQLHIETSSKSEIKITARTKGNVKSTIIPVTSANSAFLSTLTSLSSSTHTHNRICAAPSRSQQPIKFWRSISWNGQESSPEVDTGYCPQSRPLFKRRCYLYIQMGLCSSTLRTWLSERNEKILKSENQFDVVNEKENQNIFKQILEGMNYIHEQGILHRDVTPKNIFLCRKDDGHPLVKIGDFGLAREDVVTERKTPMRFQREQQQDVGMSSVGPCVSKGYTSGIGTVEYVAPEQLNESTYDNKCDMFSVGLILLELYHPFRRISDKHECFKKVYEENIPEELQKRWPVQYSAIQCLTSHDSQERPSASDLLSGDMFPSKDKAGLAEKTHSELVLTDRVLELEASRITLHAELTAEQQETANLKKQTELQGGLLAESISKCELLEEQIVTKDNVQKDMQQKIEVLEKELAKQHELYKSYEVKLESKMKDIESPEGKIQRLKKVSTQRDPVNSQRDAERCPLKENRIPKSHQTSGQQWD